MKHLLTFVLCGFFSLFGFVAWLAIQVEPVDYAITPALPTVEVEPVSITACDAVQSARVNPSELSGAAIHSDLAQYNA